VIAARVVGAAVALVVCAWFALGFAETHELSSATAAVSGAGHVNAAHVRSLLSDAGALNPDRTVDIVRAELAIREGRLAQARQILGGVVRAEPDNLDAWYWLAKASSNRPGTFLLALLKIRQLDPPVH
jgi:hypothetical protein